VVEKSVARRGWGHCDDTFTTFTAVILPSSPSPTIRPWVSDLLVCASASVDHIVIATIFNTVPSRSSRIYGGKHTLATTIGQHYDQGASFRFLFFAEIVR